MCEHLAELEKMLKEKGIRETWRGTPWSHNCREWVYFDCVLDTEKIRARMKIPDFVTFQTNGDPKSGTEAGFYCEHCHDAIMGCHPHYALNKIVVM